MQNRLFDTVSHIVADALRGLPCACLSKRYEQFDGVSRAALAEVIRYASSCDAGAAGDSGDTDSGRTKIAHARATTHIGIVALSRSPHNDVDTFVATVGRGCIAVISADMYDLEFFYRADYALTGVEGAVIAAIVREVGKPIPVSSSNMHAMADECFDAHYATYTVDSAATPPPYTICDNPRVAVGWCSVGAVDPAAQGLHAHTLAMSLRSCSADELQAIREVVEYHMFPAAYDALDTLAAWKRYATRGDVYMSVYGDPHSREKLRIDFRENTRRKLRAASCGMSSRGKITFLRKHIERTAWAVARENTSPCTWFAVLDAIEAALNNPPPRAAVAE